jgi:hypothetical protein
VLGVLHSWGAPLESSLVYDADPSQKPVDLRACDIAAQVYRIGTPCDVDASKIGEVLAAGKSVALGFDCHESFELTGEDGIIPRPILNGTEDPVMGGHAVLCVGLEPRGLILKNSWSRFWGENGYCYADPEYFLPMVFEAMTAAD